MDGSFNFGYNGSTSNYAQTNHALYFGVNGRVDGYYYDPKFLSFSVVPNYGRSQDNDFAAGVDNNQGYTATARLFSGGKFPGTISFGQNWNDFGSYGDFGTLSASSHVNTFGASWSALLPKMPTLLVSYGRSSGSSELVGATSEVQSDTGVFSVGSGYSIAGFNINARYLRSTVDVDAPSVLELDQAMTSDTTTNTFQVSANHPLPLHGTSNISYSHNTFTTESGSPLTGVGSGSQSNFLTTGSDDNVNGLAAFNIMKVSVFANATYFSNTTADIQQQLLTAGSVTGVGQNQNFGQQQLLLDFNASRNVVLPGHVVVTGYFNRLERMLGGYDYGFTQFGGTVSYNFSKIIKGLTIEIGAYDAANKYGNLGATIIGSVSYEREVGRWDLQARAEQDQAVETYGEFRTVTMYTYSGSANRRLGDRFKFFLGAGGGHTGFGLPNGTDGKDYYGTAGFAYRGTSVNGTYTQSNGAAIYTLNGLTQAPTMLAGALPAGNFILYNSTSFGANASAAPTRKLLIIALYRKFENNLQSPLLTTNIVSSLAGFSVNYHFRKLSFQTGVNSVRASNAATASGAPQVITSFYVGLSRWFNVF